MKMSEGSRYPGPILRAATAFRKSLSLRSQVKSRGNTEGTTWTQEPARLALIVSPFCLCCMASPVGRKLTPSLQCVLGNARVQTCFLHSKRNKIASACFTRLKHQYKPWLVLVWSGGSYSHRCVLRDSSLSTNTVLCLASKMNSASFI